MTAVAVSPRSLTAVGTGGCDGRHEMVVCGAAQTQCSQSRSRLFFVELVYHYVIMINHMKRDLSLDALLDLDGQVLVVDPETNHWVRFVVRRVPVTEGKPHGLDYALSLHGANGERLVGFDNAHAVRESAGPGGRKRGAQDHRHRLKTVPPYEYRDAATLLGDFIAFSGEVETGSPQKTRQTQENPRSMRSYVSEE
jgi:Family of unknown function (DUF6516)